MHTITISICIKLNNFRGETKIWKLCFFRDIIFYFGIINIIYGTELLKFKVEQQIKWLWIYRKLLLPIRISIKHFYNRCRHLHEENFKNCDRWRAIWIACRGALKKIQKCFLVKTVRGAWWFFPSSPPTIFIKYIYNNIHLQLSLSILSILCFYFNLLPKKKL